MVATAAGHASLTPMALETIAAAALLALVVALALALVYALVAGTGAWALMLLLGVLRLIWGTARGAGRGLRSHLHRAHRRVREITPETAPDLRARPLG